MDDLKPCPFCGGEAHVRMVPDWGSYQCMCEQCTAVSDDATTKERAAEQWNTRATPPEVTALVEALRWYAGTVCNCNRHGSDGDMARDRLANDIGNRAREALAKWEAAQK